MVHILCLKSFSPKLKALNDDMSLFVTELNLLTEEEMELVLTTENKARDAMLGMLSHAIDDLLEDTDKTHIIVPKGTVLAGKVCDLRSECSKLHDLFVRDNPNEYVVSVVLFTSMFKLLVILSCPAFMSDDTVFCVQPAVLIGVFCIFLSLSFPRALFRALQNPFSENGGINVDNLIASTELCLFQTTRILWRKVDKENDSSAGSDMARISKRHQLVTMRQNCRFRKSHLKGTFGDL